MSEERFQRALERVLQHEGGYSNHPRDPGKRTMRGVTEKVFHSYLKRRGKEKRDVKTITDEEIQDIYRRQYWDKVSADELPEGLAYTVFDAAVNSGPRQSVKWLQRALGVADDGIVGEQTLEAAEECDVYGAIEDCCDRRLAMLRRLKTWPDFGKGWTSRVEGVRTTAMAWAHQPEAPLPAIFAVPEGKYRGMNVRPEFELSRTTKLKDLLKDNGSKTALGGTVATVSVALAEVERVKDEVTHLAHEAEGLLNVLNLGSLFMNAKPFIIVGFALIAAFGVWMIVSKLRDDNDDM